MDKSREEFEKWFKSDYHPDKAGPYIKDIMRFAWQASRKALVVNIDSHTEFEIEHIASPKEDGYAKGWIDGRNYSVRQVEYAGITVKQ